MNTTVQTKPKATLPDPDINEVSKPYWDALKKGKLTFQHCRKCGNNWLPARGECPKCLEADWAWHDASGKAKLISWVVFHRAFHPAFEDRLPFSGVPTIYAALLEVPIGDNDISSLEYAICGAAPMPAKLIEAFEAKTGLKIVEGYGLTESTCVSSLNPPEGKRRAGSIGLRLPYQQMRVVILDDAGRFLRMADVDEIGTIAITGPNVFAGYLDPQQNKDLWIDIEGSRWLNTGDLGRQDGLGYFWLAGRRKELIIRGGHNIDPKMIEDALSKH